MTLGALSESLDLHENTVRGHLAALLAEGRVTRSRAAADGRGRPAWLWRAARSDPASPYATLAGVLASSIARHSENPGADAREAGRAWGQEILADCPEPLRSADARRRIVQVMADHGFAPDDDGSDVGLFRCPLLAIARDQPRVVCAVHRGMIDGLLAPDEDGAPEVELLPFAAADRCVLRLPSQA